MLYPCPSHRTGRICVSLWPYNYGGKFTFESNACFDAWLKSRAQNSGVRDFEAVNRLAATHGLELMRDIEMPSNNWILVWEARGRLRWYSPSTQVSKPFGSGSFTPANYLRMSRTIPSDFRKIML